MQIWPNFSKCFLETIMPVKLSFYQLTITMSFIIELLVLEGEEKFMPQVFKFVLHLRLHENSEYFP